MTFDAQRFERALQLIDAANAEDPRSDLDASGQKVPRELLYSQRMTDMLKRFAPEASEVVQLAARAQHIQRWKVPRDSFPQDRDGYLQWRSTLYRFHAETITALLNLAGYEEELVRQVADAVGKRGLKVNAESQLLEDVANLVFVEHYLQDFASKKADYSEDKWLTIIRKTWNKMSSPAREFATGGLVALPESFMPILVKAISQDDTA